MQTDCSVAVCLQGPRYRVQFARLYGLFRQGRCELVGRRYPEWVISTLFELRFLQVSVKSQERFTRLFGEYPNAEKSFDCTDNLRRDCRRHGRQNLL